MLTDEELTKKTPSNPEVKADYGNFSMTPCSKQGWESAFQGCIKQGCFIRAYREVFTAALKG